MSILIVTRVAFRSLALIFTQKLLSQVNAGPSASAGSDSVARSMHYGRLLEYLHRAERLEDARRTLDAADLDSCDEVSKEFLRVNDVENLLDAARTAESSMAWAVGMFQEAAEVSHTVGKLAKLEKATGGSTVTHGADEWICCECARVNKDSDSRCGYCEAAREDAQVEDLDDLRAASDDEMIVETLRRPMRRKGR